MAKIKLAAKAKKNYMFLGILIVAVLAVGGYLLWGQLAKAGARQAVEDALARIQLSGQVVYADIYEDCSGKNLALFGEEQKCGYAGYKIYRHKGDLATSIKNADEALKSIGLEASRAFTIEKSGEIPYHMAKSSLLGTLNYMTSEVKGATASFGQSGAITLDDGFLYGVTIYSPR